MRLVVFVVGAMLLSSAGCHRDPKLGKVTGSVTFQGTPVSEAVVVFSNAESGRSITAAVRSDGSYQVETAGGFGLPTGKYEVYLMPPAQEIAPGDRPPFPPPKAYPNIPAKFRDAKTSGLSVTVVEGETKFDIAM